MFRHYLLLLLLLGLQAAATAQRKFEVWNKNQIDTELNNHFHLKAAEKVHYLPKANSVALTYGELFIFRDIQDWLELSAGYRLTKYHVSASVWESENRPMFTADFKKSVKGVKFILYNRFEYRFFESQSNHFRYRQAFKLQFPKLTSWGMQFYASEELFVKLNGTGAHLARFYSGLQAFKKKHISVSLYYALQKSKSVETWQYSDVAGLDMRFSI